MNNIDTKQKYDSYLPVYKKIIELSQADCFNICEFETPFFAGHIEYSTKDELFTNYPYYKDNSTSANGFWIAYFSQFPVEDVNELEFKAQPDGIYRYYLAGTSTIDGKEVRVVCTHLANGIPNNIAPLQMRQLIEDFEDYPYVVILADWNSSPADFQPLKDAGYTLANNDAFGTKPTYYNRDIYEGAMDNIAVKGGRIINTRVINTNNYGVGVLSDHYLLYCDVRFN